MKISFKIWDVDTGLQFGTFEDIMNPLEGTMPRPTVQGSVQDATGSAWGKRIWLEQKTAGSKGQTKASNMQADPASASAKSQIYTSHNLPIQWATQEMPEAVARLYRLLVLQPQSTDFTPGGSNFALDSNGEIVETRMQFDVASHSVLVSHRFSLSADSLVDEACLRMEPEERAFSPEEWGSQFTGAVFHPICSSANNQL
jgi:hypothetical protein